MSFDTVQPYGTARHSKGKVKVSLVEITSDRGPNSGQKRLVLDIRGWVQNSNTGYNGPSKESFMMVDETELNTLINALQNAANDLVNHGGVLGVIDATPVADQAKAARAARKKIPAKK